MAAKLKGLTEEEIRELPAVIDIPTAGLAWKMGEAKSYRLARAGKFPCEVKPLGGRKVVLKTVLLAALGMTPDSPAHAAPAAREAPAA